MDSRRALGADPEAAHVFEPIEQRDDVGGRRRFRIIPQPRESGAAHFWIDLQQLIERIPDGVHQAIRQGLERLLSSPRPGRQSDPLQHSRGGEQHIRAAQMVEYRLDDRFAAIGRPRSVRAHPQAGAPIGQPETPKGQTFLEFDQMLTARLAPTSVVTKQRGVDADLVRNKGEHRRRRRRSPMHPNA